MGMRAGSLVAVVALHAVGFAALATWTPVRPVASDRPPLAVRLVEEAQPEPLPVVEAAVPPAPPPVVPMRKPAPWTPTPPAARTPPLPAPALLAAPPTSTIDAMPSFVVAPQPEPGPAPPPEVPVAAEAPPAPPEPMAAASPPMRQPEPEPPRTITTGIAFERVPRPVYPVAARRAGESGEVVLRVLVDPAGRPGQIVVQRSSGSRRLDAAAREAMAEALFKPHTEDGRALAMWAVVPVIFKLDE